MISVTVRRSEGRVCAFEVVNHGKSDVCAAVSLLAFNTVNSIEALTEETFTGDYDPEGGYLQWIRGEDSFCKEADSGADLLLEAMMLGLKSLLED